MTDERRPIETCPRDGRWFFVYNGDSDIPNVGRPYSPTSQEFECFHTVGEILPPPTHWRPLHEDE